MQSWPAAADDDDDDRRNKPDRCHDLAIVRDVSLTGLGVGRELADAYVISDRVSECQVY